MFPGFDSLTPDPSAAWSLLVAGWFVDYLLVACRLTGLLVVLPGFRISALPWHLKCLLVIVTAAVITPNVLLSDRSLQRPTPAIQQTALEQAGTGQAFEIDPQIPPESRIASTSTRNSAADVARLGATELCLGLLLGIGANLVVQSFRMAGCLIDQQIGGMNMATSTFENSDEGTVTGELLFWLASALFFLIGGHLLLISSLLKTFESLPPGSGDLNLELLPTLALLVHQSLSLALQVSGPILAIQLLGGLVLSQAGMVAPQFQHSGVAMIVRLSLATLVLLVTLSGMSDVILNALATGGSIISQR